MTGRDLPGPVANRSRGAHGARCAESAEGDGAGKRADCSRPINKSLRATYQQGARTDCAAVADLQDGRAEVTREVRALQQRRNQQAIPANRREGQRAQFDRAMGARHRATARRLARVARHAGQETLHSVSAAPTRRPFAVIRNSRIVDSCGPVRFLMMESARLTGRVPRRNEAAAAVGQEAQVQRCRHRRGDDVLLHHRDHRSGGIRGLARDSTRRWAA
jgi:hypothetical protein